MDIPENLDGFLTTVLGNSPDDVPAPRVELDEVEHAFVDRMMDSVTTGSNGIVVMLHPNDRLQCLLLNTNRAHAVTVLATVIKRIAEAIETDAS